MIDATEGIFERFLNLFSNCNVLYFPKALTFLYVKKRLSSFQGAYQ